MKIFTLKALVFLLACTMAVAFEPLVNVHNGRYTIWLPEFGTLFDSEHPIERCRKISLGATTVVLWTTVLSHEEQKSWYAVFASGKKPSRAYEASGHIKLRHTQFDPLAECPQTVSTSEMSTQLFIVQFETAILDIYRTEIRKLGVGIVGYIPDQAYLLRVPPDKYHRIVSLPFVRWVGPYLPKYRVDQRLAAKLSVENLETLTCNILVSNPDQRSSVARRLTQQGGEIDSAAAGKRLIRVTVAPDQVRRIVAWDEVLFIDEWGPMEPDMDIIRESTGANYIETMAGFTGSGVRGEVLDIGFNVNHVDFDSRELIQHTTVSDNNHGASTSGILFGDGFGNPQARGLLPDGQGIVADWTQVILGDRYAHTAELLTGPYQAVFQSNSVGSPRVSEYTTLSAEMDSIIFDLDILLCQAMGPFAGTDARPEAWAKNIAAVGGLWHFNTLDKSDDCWNCGGMGQAGAPGPADDGRIKPDFVHHYEQIFTVTGGGPTNYAEFGGTSATTPIVCGHFGLFFQMWSEGIFGNPVTPGGSVFDNRPHESTARAMMINSVFAYSFSGTGHDLARLHQGWGMPDLQRLYDRRSKMFIVNETDLISALQVNAYPLTVFPGEEELRVTLVYPDPPGNPAAAQARVNDLTLKVTSPSNVVFWGNHGLLEGNLSLTGGNPDPLNTIENVWLTNPEPGTWTVEVLADEINVDGHAETPELDADYALVASGVNVLGFMLSSWPVGVTILDLIPFFEN